MERLSKENEYQRQGSSQLQYTNKILEKKKEKIYIYVCMYSFIHI